MKLENTYFLTQIFAGIAVVVSLIFVGVSVRQNTDAIRSQEIAAIYEQGQAQQLIRMSSEFSKVYTKALYNPSELTVDEIDRVISYFSFRFNSLERGYLAYLDGIILKEDWEAQLFNVPVFLGTRFGQAMWVDLKNDYSNNPDFLTEIERGLNMSPIVPDDDFILNLQDRFQNL